MDHNNTHFMHGNHNKIFFLGVYGYLILKPGKHTQFEPKFFRKQHLHNMTTGTTICRSCSVSPPVA